MHMAPMQQQQGHGSYMHEQPMNYSHSLPESKYRWKLHRLGIGEVIVGCLSGMVAYFSIQASTSWYHYAPFGGYCLWCNIFLIISGVLGFYMKSKSSKCMYNANMSMSIISALFMAALVVLSTLIAAFNTQGDNILTMVYSFSALLGFVGLVLSILHSAYCCAGVCYTNGYSGVQVIYVPHNQMVPVQLPNGQIVMYPTQLNTPCGGTQSSSNQLEAAQIQQPSHDEPPSYDEVHATK